MPDQPDSTKTAIGLAAIAVVSIFSYLVMVSHGKASLTIQASVHNIAMDIEERWVSLD